MSKVSAKNLPSEGLMGRFLRSVESFPAHTALVVGGKSLTYRDLYCSASRITSAIVQHEQASTPLVGVLAHRSLTAYASILGVLGAGRGYVPLNPRFPKART